MEAGRLNAYQAAPEAMRAVQRVEGYVQQCGLEKGLIELVKMRASQINGCAYCLDVHSKDARRAGETEQRLYLLDAWHESPLYTERERAALAWTEAVTLVSQTHVPDPVFEQVRRHFSEEELVKLTLLGTRRDVPFADPEWATGISRGCSTGSRHDIGWT